MVDPIEVARRFRMENDREKAAIEGRRERAVEAGRHLAEAIVQRHPEVRKVWGFGSTFETWRSYRMDSDIDLAFEEGDVLELSRMVEDFDFSVDLVDLSECPGTLAAFIRSQGVVLAETGT